MQTVGIGELKDATATASIVLCCVGVAAAMVAMMLSGRYCIERMKPLFNNDAFVPRSEKNDA